MQRGQKSQSRVKHQRSVGRYNSPYQRGGTIFSPMNPWAMTSYKPYGVDPLRLHQFKKKRRIDALNRKEEVCTKSLIHGPPKVESIKGVADDVKPSLCQHVIESV